MDFDHETRYSQTYNRGRPGEVAVLRGATLSVARGEVMPQFSPLLDNQNLVLFDSGDGIDTPTPLRLVQLGQYVQTLQR